MNIQKTKMRTTALLAVTCFGALAGNALAAEPGIPLHQQVVLFADLDVSRPQGIVVLYGRIERAASRVCEPFSTREPSQVVGARRCADQAITRAVNNLNIRALTSYYLVKTGRADPAPPLAKHP